MGVGWACAWLQGTALRYAEELACQPTAGPYLEEFQAIFEALVAHVFFPRRVSATAEKLGPLAEYKAKEISKCAEDECRSDDRHYDVTRKLTFELEAACVFAFRPCWISWEISVGATG